jgi:energy-coupling factor transport system permease protein
MQDLDFLRHITLGQYFPRRSVVHALDPRVKLLGVALLAAAISFNASYAANAILLAACFAIALLSLISPLYILSGLRPAIPFIVFFALIQVAFFTGPYGPTLHPRQLLHLGALVVTDSGVRLVLISVARLLELWLLTSLLTNTTPISTLAGGLESLLRPLSALGFPSHDLALVFTLALRFLPVFALELEDTMKAQISRGVQWNSGRLAFVANSRRIAALLVPLFVDALRRAEGLATAMEARCYVSRRRSIGGGGHTSLLHLRFQARDWVALAALSAFAGALILCRNAFPW